MARWIFGVPVPGVWSRTYKDGWSAQAEPMLNGRWRAVVLSSGCEVTRSIVCDDLADAKATAIRYAQEDR